MHWRFQWNLLRDWLLVKYVRRIFQLRPMMFTVCCNHTWCAHSAPDGTLTRNKWLACKRSSSCEFNFLNCSSRALLQKKWCGCVANGSTDRELKPLTDHRCHLTHIISLCVSPAGERMRVGVWWENLLPKNK